jgi:hypothetical protein
LPSAPDSCAAAGSFPADAIRAIDGRSGVIGLRLVRDSIQSFG